MSSLRVLEVRCPKVQVSAELAPHGGSKAKSVSLLRKLLDATYILWLVVLFPTSNANLLMVTSHHRLGLYSHYSYDYLIH